MRIIIDLTSEARRFLTELFNSKLNERFNRIEGKLDMLLSMEKIEMVAIDQLASDVADETTMIDSLGVFIQGLKDAAAQAGVDQNKINEIFAQVEANKAKLAAALQANVPPAATTPPAPPSNP